MISKNKYYKLRITNPGNKCGDTVAITVPSEIALNFGPDTYFKATCIGTTIVYESGTPPFLKVKQ